MVLTRSPLRISLGGGGTDLPSYYRKHGGFLISAAIDKYVFVSVLLSLWPGHLPEVLPGRERAENRRRSSTRIIRECARPLMKQRAPAD